MKNLLVDALSSPDGSISFMRLGCFLILICVLFNWCFLTVVHKTSQPLDWSEVALVLGSMGIKVAQRPFESKPAAPTP